MRGARPSRRTEKILEQKAHSHDFGAAQHFSHVAQRNVRGDERDCERASGEKHGEIFHAGAGREELGLPRELEADGLHARFMDRTSDHGIDFARHGQARAFFQRGVSRSRRVGAGGSPLRAAPISPITRYSNSSQTAQRPAPRSIISGPDSLPDLRE